MSKNIYKKKNLSKKFFYFFTFKFVTLSMESWKGTPYLMMIFFSDELEYLSNLVDLIGESSTHLLNYFDVVMMKLWTY